mmetsp:Transcript_16741/g.31321  ORF Transcript_16741/g.31321 Transcript_16741/m.31321 type:complete len:167 (-) Transcript_16741:49-549(-)|eukprot:scaffold9272_cov195-Amphora_coffeaeformis.AAC.11
MKLTDNIFITSVLFFNMLSVGQARSSSSSSRKETCVKYWEWTIEDASMVIDEEQYYGFQLDNSIGTYTLPVFDNIDLQGEPVARLRGSMIADATGGFTSNGALYFYDDHAYLGFHVSYSPDPLLEEDFVYGFTVGGTGKYKYLNAAATSVVVSYEPKFIVEWTFCY